MLNKWTIAVDPGLVTGVALLGRVDEHVWLEDSHELDPYDTWRWVDSRLITLHHEGGVDVVVEDFVITKATAEKSQAPWSLEIRGMVRGLVWQHLGINAQITGQRPSDAKALFPSGRLRHLGLWHKGGKGHATDAIRHGALYLVRQGWRDPRLADAW